MAEVAKIAVAETKKALTLRPKSYSWTSFKTIIKYNCSVKLQTRNLLQTRNTSNRILHNSKPIRDRVESKLEKEKNTEEMGEAFEASRITEVTNANVHGSSTLQ